MIRVNLRCIALSLMFFLSTQVFVHAMVRNQSTENLLSKNADISEKIATGMRLIQYDPQARFGENRDIFVQSFRNEQDQGAFCSRAIKLLQEVYMQLGAQDGVEVHESCTSEVMVLLRECCGCFEYDSDSVEAEEISPAVKARVKRNAQYLQSVLADLIEGMDEIGRLRFLSTFLNELAYELYQSNRSVWFEVTRDIHPYFSGVESLGLIKTFAVSLRNERFVHGEALFAFGSCPQVLGSENLFFKQV